MNASNFSAYAKLMDGHKLMGLRFSSGYLNEYLDLPIDEVCKLFNLEKEKAVRHFEDPYTIHEIPKSPFFCLDNTCVFRGNNVSSTYSPFSTRMCSLREIAVKSDMTPMKEWNKTATIHCSSGITTKVPFISPERAIEVVTAMDGLIYGTDFLQKFNVMSIPDMKVTPVFSPTGKFNKELVDAAEAEALAFLSIPISVPEEKVMGWVNTWLEALNIKNVLITIAPMKKVYNMTIKTFSSESTVSSVPYTGLMSNLFRKINHDGKSVYSDGNGNYYAFGNYDPKLVGFKTDCMSEASEKYDVKYIFSRLIPYNGEIYQLQMGRQSGHYMMSQMTNNLVNIIDAIDFMHQNTPLDEIIVNAAMDIPEITGDKYKAKCCFSFTLDEGSALIEAFGDNVKLCIYDAWADYVNEHKESWDFSKTVTPLVSFDGVNKLCLSLYI